MTFTIHLRIALNQTLVLFEETNRQFARIEIDFFKFLPRTNCSNRKDHFYFEHT
jgi:hypothetical protein